MPSRDAEIFRLILRGLSRETIIIYATQEKWSETPAEIDDLIDAAYAELANKAASVDTDAEFGLAFVRLNDLYMDAKKVQDTRTALQVQKEINKLLALQKAGAGAGRSTARGTTTPQEKPRLKIVQN